MRANWYTRQLVNANPRTGTLECSYAYGSRLNGTTRQANNHLFSDLICSSLCAILMDTRVFRDPPERTLEDFAVGDVILTRGRTVEASDLIAFAGLTGDHYPLHTDEEFGKGTRFGSRIAHGPFTFAIAVGLVGMTGYYGDSIIALVEVQSLRALKPVQPGDTLSVRAEVEVCEPGDSPRHGTLEVSYSVRNQKEVEVMTFRQIMRARRRPAAESDRG
jgi:3-hydroxybutyryl-CoA dehydratase